MGVQGNDGNRNGRTMNINMDESSIGMPDQKVGPWMPWSTGEKMRRSGTKDQTQVFDNNGGDSKGDGGGTINKNGDYGPITYGF